MKKSNLNFQTEFCNNLCDIERLTNELFKNILSDVQTKGKGEINSAQHNYCENCILMLYQFEGLKKYVFD